MPQNEQEIQSRKRFTRLFIHLFRLENSERVDERDASFCCYQAQTAAAHNYYHYYTAVFLFFVIILSLFFVICWRERINDVIRVFLSPKKGVMLMPFSPKRISRRWETRERLIDLFSPKRESLDILTVVAILHVCCIGPNCAKSFLSKGARWLRLKFPPPPWANTILKE